MDISKKDTASPLDTYGIYGTPLKSAKHMKVLQDIDKKLYSIEHMLPELRDKCNKHESSLRVDTLENRCEIIKDRIDGAELLTNLLQLLEEPFDRKSNRYLLLSENKYNLLKVICEAYEICHTDAQENQRLLTLKNHNRIRVVDNFENTDVMKITYDATFYSQYYSVITLLEIENMINKTDDLISSLIDKYISPFIYNIERESKLLHQTADDEQQQIIAIDAMAAGKFNKTISISLESSKPLQKFLHFKEDEIIMLNDTIPDESMKSIDLWSDPSYKDLQLLYEQSQKVKEEIEEEIEEVYTIPSGKSIESISLHNNALYKNLQILTEDEQAIQQITTEITSKADTKSTLQTTEVTEEQTITPTP